MESSQETAGLLYYIYLGRDRSVKHMKAFIWSHPVFLAVAVSALVLAAFSPSLRGSFVWEDKLNLLEGRDGSDLSPSGWFLAQTGGDFKPLVWFSYAFDRFFWDFNPQGYHLAGILLHSLSTLLVYLVIFRLGNGYIPPLVSLLGAILWSFHPLRVESVVWITERKDTLFLPLYLLSVLSYLRYGLRAYEVASAPMRHERCPLGTPGATGWTGPGPRSADRGRHGSKALWYAAAVLFGILALLAKPMAVSLPLVLLLIDYFPLRRSKRVSWRRLALEKAPLFLAAFAVGIVALVLQSRHEALASLESVPLLRRLPILGQTGLLYLIKTLVPVGLYPVYPPGHPAFSSVPAGWAALLALLALSLLAALLSRRGRPWTVLGWGWYLLAWLPVSGIFQTGISPAADRFSYLPSIGLSILISFAICGLKRKGRLSALGAGFLAAGALGFASFRQCSVWNNDLTLWNHGVKIDSAAAHFNLGNALKATRDPLRAIAHYREAIRIKPDYGGAHYNLAIALADSGSIEEALVHYREAVRLDPTALKPRNNLGNALAALGRRKEAEREYAAILAIDPAHAEAHNNLANLLAARGEYKEAIDHYRRALEIAPDYTDALFNLGYTLALTGRTAEAAEFYRRTLLIDPEYEKARANLILLQREKGGI